MKLRTVLASSLLVTAFSANAFSFFDSLKETFGFGSKEPTEQVSKEAGENAPQEEAVVDNLEVNSSKLDSSVIETSAVENAINSVAGGNPLVSMAAQQLGLSPAITTGALGAVFKVAKDNLGDNFSTISEAIPGVDNFIENAPAEVKSSLGNAAASLGGNAQALASLGYLDSAFKSLGIPKETMLPLANTVSTYLESNNMGSAAQLLKQGLNFL